MSQDLIKVGDYVIIQRQKYTKLFKFSASDTFAALGKESVELRNIENQPYFTTFKMIASFAKGKRRMDLEPCTDIVSLKESVNLSITESGSDNRNLVADGSSQNLKQNDIDRLREAGSSAAEIVGQIVENSKTFTSKTEYAQDKYIKKKEKKYFEYLQIRRPTIRLLTEIMYRQDADKIYNLRTDSLSQMISYAGVCGVGNYMLYESGTNGLAPAALLNSIGANTEAKLLHMHQGNIPQRQAILALNLQQEQLDRCISVNLYSVLRQYYQSRDGDVEIIEEGKRKAEDANGNDEVSEPPAKIAKRENSDEEVKVADESEVNPNGNSPAEGDENATPKWKIENERACELLRENLDAIVIVSREHPMSILKALLPFVKASRPVVIFNTSREILMELYGDLKALGTVTGLRLTSTWMRPYQILPNRTHPDVNMSGNSGFLLCGHTVR